MADEKDRKLNAGPAGASTYPGVPPAPTLEKKEGQQPIGATGRAPPLIRSVSQRILVSSPNLRQKLRLAGMNDDPLLFIQQSLVTAGMMSVMFTVLFFFLLQLFKISLVALVVLFPIFFLASFMLRMQYPTSKARKRAREVDRELVFAGRQMLIELKAGVPLFDAMLSISRDYGEISKEFAKIVDRVNAGVPTDVAMHDVAEDNPSMAFKRVILQLINSIRSGSDVAKALGSVLDQISREQITELKAYGQKLNPLGMFYMVFGIIMPSLGIALAIIIFSFLSINLDVTFLYAFLLGVAMVQYIFVTVIESQKPQYEF
ncbi:Type II secretion system (T2SS), protein F [uncultured archaeon]|nr:Type II secretion system (T2SS), protein F [uncultured archaeon]